MTQVWSADVHEGKWRSENVKLMQPQLLGVILFRKKNISSSGPIWQNVLPSFVTLVLVVWPTMRTWVRWTCRDQARSVMPDPDYHQHPSCHLKTRLLRHLGVILFFFDTFWRKKVGRSAQSVQTISKSSWQVATWASQRVRSVSDWLQQPEAVRPRCGLSPCVALTPQP